MTDASFSYKMFDQTERPGAPFPIETHKIITHRYQFAGTLAKGKRALEIGCGAGMGLAYLKECASFLVASEYSAENIETIIRHHNDVCPLLRLNANHLPFADDSFDVIAAMAMIYYLRLTDFLAEARRILSPGGVLFFDTSNKNMPGFWPSPYITRYYSVPELNQILQASGFTPTFYGVFPAAEPLIKRKLKAFIKNAIKRPMLLLPGGHKIWVKLRQSRLPEGVPLPEQIGALDCSDVGMKEIDPTKPDRTHSVIYIKAIRRDNSAHTS